MKNMLQLLMLNFLILNLNCARVKVKTNYNRDINFRKYKTFSWVEQPERPFAHITDPVRVRLKIDEHVKEAVNLELSKLGYHLDSDNPDFLVAFHTGVHDKLKVQDWGYAYARSSRYWGGRDDIELTYYKEGTLILDFVDTSTKELSWRGSATRILEPGEPDPDIVAERIRRAVKKILEKFPPK